MIYLVVKECRVRRMNPRTVASEPRPLRHLHGIKDDSDDSDDDENIGKKTFRDRAAAMIGKRGAYEVEW